MKRKFNLTKNSIFLFLFLIISVSCSKDSEENNEPGIAQTNGITEDELDAYKGDLGILIYTRDLIRKGYKPSKVNITTNASNGNYDRQLSIDINSNLARLSFPIDSLSSIQVNELKSGIDLNLEILNESDNVIATESFSSVSFKENGNQIHLNATSLPYVYQELNFKENSRYYLQLVNEDGSYGNQIVVKPSSLGDDWGTLERRSSQSFNQGTTSEQFYIKKIPNVSNEFAFISANSNLSRYLTIGNVSRALGQSGTYSYPDTAPADLLPDYRFIIEKASNGLYIIKGTNDGNALRRATNSNGTLGWTTKTTGIIQYFRIVSLDIKWTIEEISTHFSKPIYPSASTSFGFNSTLRNCGSGSLEQQVGVEEKITTSFTSSFTESVGLTSRVGSTTKVTVGAKTEAKFFGSGGEVSGEASTELEVSIEANKTRTVGKEATTTKENTFFSNRTVTVPAGSASLVFDAYQTYSNIRIPFVKRIKLTGIDESNGNELSGEEIASQLYLTGFQGTILSVETNNVKITLEGNIFLNNVVEAKTEVRDVPANCSN
jgi:hypothetical protein